MAEIGNVTVRVDAVITDEQYREAMGAVRAANERMGLLEAENAKLRELVRYAYECAIHSDHATCDDCRRMNSSCILADRMRELGVGR